MTNQLSHFAIHADDLERARKFYGGVFGWTFQGFGGGPMTDFCQILDAEGNRLAPLGAMQSRKFNAAPQPVSGFECSIAVNDVDAIAKAVAANGGKIVMPKAAIPGVGWIVKFMDSEGNLACAVQYDAAAK
ncbi:MAG TPA: VOC family protein [Candidatus Dormibacteraeota bacterium]|nr:VOC family protein [Candidatus Dormibacteraeota bacterium]